MKHKYERVGAHHGKGGQRGLRGEETRPGSSRVRQRGLPDRRADRLIDQFSHKILGN